jgi:hypothetical protein
MKFTENQEINEALSTLKGQSLQRPVHKNSIWIFGGEHSDSQLVLEVGSYWQWQYGQEMVFDSLDLSQAEADKQWARFAPEQFRIRRIVRHTGEYFTIYCENHCSLDIQPVNIFDPSGHTHSPLKLVLKWQGEEWYRDWKHK